MAEAYLCRFDADQSANALAYVKLWDGSKQGGALKRDNRKRGRCMTDTILAVLDDIDSGLAARLASAKAAGEVPSIDQADDIMLCDLRMLRSLVLLWSGQNAALTGDSDNVRRWMTDRLPDISQRLERIDTRVGQALAAKRCHPGKIAPLSAVNCNMDAL